MKKGQVLTNIRVTTVGFGGVGIGIADNGKKILIKGSVLPHSVIDCLIVKSKKDHILGMPLRVVSIDPERADATPRCPHYTNPLQVVPDDYIHKNGCGGCKRQLLSYAKQLELKTHLVEDSFRMWPYILQEHTLEPIIPSPLQYHYRNKIEFSFGKYITKASNDRKAKSKRDGLSSSNTAKGLVDQKNNGIVHGLDASLHSAGQVSENSDFSQYHDRQLGFHKQGFYTHVIDVDQCYLISQQLHQLYTHIKQLCKDSGLPVHDPKTHRGVFRHLVMREGTNTGQILINLVVSDEQINTPQLSDARVVFKKTLQEDSLLSTACTTFLITYNNTVSDAVRRQDTHSDILWGDGVIFEELQLHPDLGSSTPSHNTSSLKPVRFRVSPFSFFQTNTLGAQLLFSTAASFISLPKNKQAIMDLYCGAGTIGLSLLAQRIGNYVLGIEIVEDAIRDAQYNARINHLEDKSYFVAGKTEHILHNDPTFVSKMDEIGLIIVDPPREGLHADVCEFINTLRKSYHFQLIYISCNPVTLARDLDLLLQGGDRSLQILQPVDMFPHTHHVEMISVLR